MSDVELSFEVIWWSFVVIQTSPLNPLWTSSGLRPPSPEEKGSGTIFIERGLEDEFCELICWTFVVIRWSFVDDRSITGLFEVTTVESEENRAGPYCWIKSLPIIVFGV